MPEKGGEKNIYSRNCCAHVGFHLIIYCADFLCLCDKMEQDSNLWDRQTEKKKLYSYVRMIEEQWRECDEDANFAWAWKMEQKWTHVSSPSCHSSHWSYIILHLTIITYMSPLTLTVSLWSERAAELVNNANSSSRGNLCNCSLEGKGAIFEAERAALVGERYGLEACRMQREDKRGAICVG